MALGAVHRQFMFLHGVTLSLVQSFVFVMLRRLFQSVSARLWCQLAAAQPSRVFTTLPNLMSVRNVMKMRFMAFSRLWMKTFTTVSDPEDRIQNHLPAKPWAWHCNQFSTLSSRLYLPACPQGYQRSLQKTGCSFLRCRAWYFIEEDDPVFLGQLVLCVLNHFCVLPVSGNALYEDLLPTVQPVAPPNLFLAFLELLSKVLFLVPQKISWQETDSPKGKTLGIRSSLSEDDVIEGF